MKKFFILATVILLMVSFGCDRNDINGDQPKVDTGRAIFTITDAPSDELSVLQVELTEMKIKDLAGNETVIFAKADGQSFLLNLLNLEDLNALLGTVPLQPGDYKELTLTYENAMAMDTEGNLLTVKDQPYGTAKVLLNPYLTVTEDNIYIEIDFDLNNSVYNIVAGPHGSLLLMPTLVVKVGPPEVDPELDEIKGTIESVSEMSLVVLFNDETLNIQLTDETVVEVGDIIVTPQTEGFDLTLLLFPGNMVEIYGTLDVLTNTVTATRIERKFQNHGLESQGLVVNITDLSFDLLVLDPRDSGFELGSTQTITYDANTFFNFTDPCEAATYDQLAIGQKVRVTGTPDDATWAQKVRMKETKLAGTVTAVNASLGQITLDVATIDGIAVDTIPGFTNPIIVDFSGEFPADIAVDDIVKLEGHFNRVTMGVFTANTCEIREEDEEDDEDGENGTWVGKIFSVITTSPLQISLSRGNGNNQTVTVNVGTSTQIIEKLKSTSTQISGDQLVDGINAGKYTQMKAKGAYDSLNKTLDATLIIMEVKKK